MNGLNRGVHEVSRESAGGSALPNKGTRNQDEIPLIGVASANKQPKSYINIDIDILYRKKISLVT